MEEIKAVDIMIGNYIRDIWSDNGFFKVTEIRKDKVYYGNCFKAKYEDLRPIPLTEDILLKCGFEKNYKSYLYKIPINGFRMLIYSHESSFRHHLNMYCSIDIKYLHQLQNLFKSLTGTDLKVEV